MVLGPGVSFDLSISDGLLFLSFLNQINTYIDIDLKNYVKTIVCYPQLSTKYMWNHCMKYPMQDSERVHINMLAMAARKQAELIHAMNAVTQLVASRE